MAVPLTHAMYAATPGDFVGSGASGQPLIIAGGALLTVWTTLTGPQLTDLYNASGDPVLAVTADGFGNFRFYAPAEFGTLWVSTDDGNNRFALQRSDVGAHLMATALEIGEVRSVAEGAAATAAAALADGGGGTGGGSGFFLAADDATAADAPPESFILIRRAV